MSQEKLPPPHNVEAEQQVLGAILGNNELFERVSDILTDEDFFDPVHARVFHSVAQKIDEGLIASPVTLKPMFDDDEGMRELDGPAYMVRMVGASVAAASVREYAQMIKDLSAKRQLIDRMKDAMLAIRDGQESASKVAMDVETEAGQIAATVTKHRIMNSFQVSMEAAVKGIAENFQNGTVQGTRSGIPELDRIVGSFFPEDSIVLAGRPGMGKSAIAQSILLNVAHAGMGVFNANLEMSNDQMMHRALSSLLARKGIKLEYNRIRNNVLSERDMKNIVLAAQEYQHLPIETAQKEAKDLRVLRSSARQAARIFEKKGIKFGLIVVDYLQLIRVKGARTEMEQINEASAAAKGMAQDFGVPVLVLSQLNRQVESREVPIPTLADLRGSGSIEQDADGVIFVYRPEYYLLKDLEAARGDHEKRIEIEAELAEVKNKVSLIVEKQRMGSPAAAQCEMHIGLNHIGSIGDADQASMVV